jgi:hypothetical protein
MASEKQVRALSSNFIVPIVISFPFNNKDSDDFWFYNVEVVMEHYIAQVLNTSNNQLTFLLLTL